MNKKMWILSISAWCFHHHSFNEVLGFTWEPMVGQIQLRSFSTAWKDHSARLCSLCSWFSCVTRRSLTISQLQTNASRLRCMSCSPSRKSSCRFCILSCSCPSEKGNHLHRKAPCNHLDSLRSAPTIEGQKPGEDLKDLSDVVVVQNSFFSKRPFLAKKKITLAKLSPYSQKTFAGPYVGLYLGSFVSKQKLDKGHLRVWATIKTHSVAAAHSRVAFCFNGGPCSPSPASSDTPTPKLRVHLLPASLQTRHNKSTV